MNCFECAKLNDAVPAVAICGRCGAGLCLDHHIEAHEFTVGGTHFTCPHELPEVRRLRGVPAGIAAAARHHGTVGA